MPRDLLIAQGASITGKWVRVEPPAHRTWPFRLIVTGNYAGDNVFIEELTGGLPGTGTTSAYPPQTDTGTVVTLLTVPPGGGDQMIELPIEFIRARTGVFTGGTTATVRLVEAQ